MSWSNCSLTILLPADGKSLLPQSWSSNCEVQAGQDLSLLLEAKEEKKKKKKALNACTYPLFILHICWCDQYQSNVLCCCCCFWLPLAVDIFEKAFFDTSMTNDKSSWAFMFSPCRYELQLCQALWSQALPPKTMFSYSTLGRGEVPCSVSLVFCLTWLVTQWSCLPLGF